VPPLPPTICLPIACSTNGHRIPAFYHLPQLQFGMCSGPAVFTVPGVHVVLPSTRGDVRFTPLFLNRQQLDDTVSAMQDLIGQHVRVHDNQALLNDVAIQAPGPLP
jgi:hypothetical protein